jgi:hypothetical protein
VDAMAAPRVPWSDVLGEGRLPRFILICLAVWLNAADSLIAATIMPSVARSICGYAFFGWATAGYLMGSVLAAASSCQSASKRDPGSARKKDTPAVPVTIVGVGRRAGAEPRRSAAPGRRRDAKVGSTRAHMRCGDLSMLT